MPGLTSKWAQTVQLGSIAPAQGAALQAAVVQACDGLDGVRDGIVSNVQAYNIPRVVHSMRCAGASNGASLSDADVDRVLGYINPLVPDRQVVGAPWSGTTNLANVVASSNGLGSGFLALAFRSPTPVNPLSYDIPNQFEDVAAVLDGVYSMAGDSDGIARYLRRGQEADPVPRLGRSGRTFLRQRQFLQGAQSDGRRCRKEQPSLHGSRCAALRGRQWRRLGRPPDDSHQMGRA